ncbi:hypothetical protein [Amycolatopsis sp. La24]|uniref:hypothetical protein n=1 Tax=Amycolatopsis sp. La24 TaxID=3028304 RepID=UPI0023AF7CB7|nr:hypothetical protein [Amycolatopsis sp. La24]
MARLGRSIQTRTAAAPCDPIDEHATEGPTESESGPGPTTESPSTDRRPGPDSTAAGDGPDRYDLIVTAADPRTLEWFRPADCADLLAANGVLAVVTRGDRSGGRLVDPAGLLVRAARHAGLRYLDRIALLRVPVRDGALAVAGPATTTRSQAPSGGMTTSARHSQVHDDLLVFTNLRAPSGTTEGEETSDD